MSIEELREALSDRDAEMRRRAVLVAQTEASHEVGEVLMQALGDEDWRVRKEAVQVVIRRANELSLVDPLLTAICQSENVGLRNAALDALQGIGEDAAKVLVNALPTVPEHARKFVVEALGEARGPQVVAELARAAASADTNVASEAIEALARIGGPEAERAIRARLTAQDPFLRMAALDALNRCGAVVAWEEIEPLLGDRLMRRVVVTALGRTGRAEAITPLFGVLEDPTPQVAGAAAAAIMSLAASSEGAKRVAYAEAARLGERTRAALRGVLASSLETDARRAAAELLVLGRDRQALPAVLQHLSGDAPVPQMVEALRSWGRAVVEPLLSMTDVLSSPRERAIALELAADLVMGETEPDPLLYEEVRAQLRAGLRDEDPLVRAACLRCLGAFGLAEDAQLLVESTMAHDAETARCAARALEELASRSPQSVQQALLELGPDASTNAALAAVSAAMGGNVAVDRLQALMSSDDREARRAAVHGLGKLRGGRAESLVSIALADEDPDVQIAAAQALGKLRDDRGTAPYVEELLLALSSELGHVRAAVARALGETGSRLAVSPLRDLLRDGESGVAMAAVEALGRLGPEQLAQRLEPALMHEDPEVVKAALRALSQWRDASAADALVGALRHAAWDVRKLSAELLGDLREPRAVGPLREQLEREVDDLVRFAISETLRHVAGEG